MSSDTDTQAWLDSAACEHECRDRQAGGSECHDRCERWLQAIEAWRRSTPERRAGFVTRRQAAKSPSGINGRL